MLDRVRIPKLTLQLLVSVSINAPEDEQALRAMLDALLTELGPV